MLVVYEPSVKEPVWSWMPPDDQKSQYAFLSHKSATEAKWAANDGSRIAAILGDGVVVLSFPDAKIEFAAKSPGNIHSLEVLPGNVLAVADDDNAEDAETGGVRLYSMDHPDAAPVQVTGLAASHGLLWDVNEQVLWAVGTNSTPYKPKNPKAVHQRLVAYQYNPKSDPPLLVVGDYPFASNPETDDPRYVEGPHDIVGVPNERRVLITTDRDVHTFDTEARAFDPVETRLRDFVSMHTERNDKKLPRSSLKSVGIAPSGLIVYAQPQWGADYPTTIDFYAPKDHATIEPETIDPHGDIYKARWYCATPGWPMAD